MSAVSQRRRGTPHCSKLDCLLRTSGQVRFSFVQRVVSFRRIHFSVGIVEQFVNRLTLRPFRTPNAQAQLEPCKVSFPVPVKQVSSNSFHNFGSAGGGWVPQKIYE